MAFENFVRKGIWKTIKHHIIGKKNIFAQEIVLTFSFKNFNAKKKHIIKARLLVKKMNEQPLDHLRRQVLPPKLGRAFDEVWLLEVCWFIKDVRKLASTNFSLVSKLASAKIS